MSIFCLLSTHIKKGSLGSGGRIERPDERSLINVTKKINHAHTERKGEEGVAGLVANDNGIRPPPILAFLGMGEEGVG
jgi:hypothetical protein